MDVLLVLMLLGLAAVVVLSLVGIFVRLPFPWLKTRRASISTLIGSSAAFVVMFFFIGITNMGARAQAPQTQARARPAAAPMPSIQRASSAITRVRVDGDTLFVEAKIEGYNPVDYLDRAVDVIEPLTAAFQAPHSENTAAVKDIVVTFTAAGIDRLGNSGVITLMAVDFSADDLRSARFDKLSGYRRLDLAHYVKVYDPELAPALQQWCAGNIATYVRPFCQTALHAG